MLMDYVRSCNVSHLMYMSVYTCWITCLNHSTDPHPLPKHPCHLESLMAAALVPVYIGSDLILLSLHTGGHCMGIAVVVANMVMKAKPGAQSLWMCVPYASSS